MKTYTSFLHRGTKVGRTNTSVMCNVVLKKWLVALCGVIYNTRIVDTIIFLKPSLSHATAPLIVLVILYLHWITYPEQQTNVKALCFYPQFLYVFYVQIAADNRLIIQILCWCAWFVQQ